ncbi:MAG: helix-turn-helix domain-containing protein [Sphingorhabdus sp.]
MFLLDAFFRFSGIGLLLMLAIITLSNFRKWESAGYLILACISVSALFLGYSPSVMQPSGILYIVARLLDIPHLVFIWLFALSLFETNFTLKWTHILVGSIYCIPLIWVRFEEFGWVANNPNMIGYVISFMSLVLMIHLCMTTLRGRKDDLLDKRRASRIYCVVVIVFVALVAAISEPLIPSSSEWRQTTKVLTIWPAIIWGFIWMTSFDGKAVTFANNSGEKNVLNEQDAQLREKLTHEMEAGLAFKEPSLSISKLASKLGVTQHRLRSLINQNLGHKNFCDFVNTYRIFEVKNALTDPKKEHLPILTLALDSGFKSLSTFNRTFKKSENLTPTEYRNLHNQK